MADIIEKHLKNCITQIQAGGRKRFGLADIEAQVIKKTGGSSEYAAYGGYNAFYDAVVKFHKDGFIKPVEASKYNGMVPPLKTRWSIAESNETDKWPETFILRVSDLLDMSGYIRNPGWQTPRERQYVESIYSFLEDAEQREWASCEERCLELFDYEKFLSTGERRVLKRLNLTFDQLKMKKYGQMFSYWIGDRNKTDRVVILENHSTFFSFKRCAEKGIPVFSFHPDLLIFGDGKSVIKSLGFLNEIADASKCEIKYFGDIDPEGWLIYKLLCQRYPELNISLFMPAYEFLLNHGKSYSIGDIMQSKNTNVIKYIVDEFERNGKGILNAEIVRLWEERRRIPQEFATFEKLKSILGQ
jgi:hypothetical protein